MRDLARITRMVNQLGVLWSLPMCADMRLGQLLVNVANAGGHGESEIWYLEDDQWETSIARAMERWA